MAWQRTFIKKKKPMTFVAGFWVSRAGEAARYTGKFRSVRYLPILGKIVNTRSRAVPIMEPENFTRSLTKFSGATLVMTEFRRLQFARRQPRKLARLAE
jgi:hypothetical protein